MEPSCDIKHIPIILDENNLQEDALKILDVIRPRWKRDKIIVKLLTEGKTNKLVECNTDDGQEEETVLVRVYGNNTELLIDRKAETRTILLLNKYQLAPQLFATFKNGLAYEFVPGVTLNDQSVRAPQIYPLIAKHMANLHKVEVEDDKLRKPILWDTLEQFLKLVPDQFSNNEKQARFKKLIKPLAVIRAEIEELKKALIALNNPIVFCHNDLLLANVIYTESKEKVTFIDFEYAGYNYQAYDIGNHFAEFVGFDTVDYTKFPSKELQLDWMKHYLSEQQDNVTEEDVDHLFVAVNHFVLAAHLLWGIWALVQTEHSHIDFDFLEYASIRFNEYFAKKDGILKLSS